MNDHSTETLEFFYSPMCFAYKTKIKTNKALRRLIVYEFFFIFFHFNFDFNF